MYVSYKIPTNFGGQEEDARRPRPRRIRFLGIISIMFCTCEGKSKTNTSENLPVRVAPTRVLSASLFAGSISRVRSRMSLRFPPPISFNQCTRRQSSRDPRSARSCCPPAVEQDPCVRSGTPACDQDRPASIGISP